MAISHTSFEHSAFVFGSKSGSGGLAKHPPTIRISGTPEDGLNRSLVAIGTFNRVACASESKTLSALCVGALVQQTETLLSI